MSAPVISIDRRRECAVCKILFLPRGPGDHYCQKCAAWITAGEAIAIARAALRGLS
jgi:hypothetical protein